MCHIVFNSRTWNPRTKSRGGSCRVTATSGRTETHRTSTGGRRETRLTTVSARKESSVAPASDTREIRFRQARVERGTLATPCKDRIPREDPEVPTRTTATSLSARRETPAPTSVRVLRRVIARKVLSPMGENPEAILWKETPSFRSTAKAAATDILPLTPVSYTHLRAHET